MSYHLTSFGSVVRDADGATIPADPENADWQEFERWVAAGNTPEEAPVETQGGGAVALPPTQDTLATNLADLLLAKGVISQKERDAIGS